MFTALFNLRPLLFSLCLLAAITLPLPAQDQSNDLLRSFGAKGDGTTDDTAAIQKAVNSGAGAIRFGKGSYRITQTILIDLDKTGFTTLIGDGVGRVVMAGAGPAFKFVGTHAGSADPNHFKPNVWERQRTPMVDGLEIVGGHAEADGIEATGTMQITITRTVIRRVRHGIHLTVRNRNVLIADCHIYENSGIGIYYDQVNLHQSNVSGCHISYCDGGGIVSRGGNVRNLHIGTCDIESNMSPKSPPTANVLLDSAGGSIGEVAITGCTLQHNNASPDGANIRILGEGDEPAQVKINGSAKTREGNVTITGNVLSDVQVNIHLQKARGVTITGNTFWSGYQHDLLVEDCSNVVVGPNAMDRNPRYIFGNAAKAAGGVIFRNSSDCTIDALHINGAEHKAAAFLIEKCNRFNVANCTVLDSDGIGLHLDNVTNSRIAGCVIRDDRAEKKATLSLKTTGGKGNWISQNLLANGQDIPASTAKVEGNYDGK